jgi:hypothetical protein
VNAEDCICSPTVLVVSGHDETCPLAAKEAAGPPARANGRQVSRRVSSPVKRPGIPRHRQLEVIRHLAAEDITRAELARRVGITRGGMTSFAKRHQAEIEQVRAQLEAEDPWPGLWVAERAQRLAAYQACYEEAAEHKNSGHAQWVMAKAHVLSSVAEELGQLPGRGAVVVVPVQHVLVGVDLDALT